MDNELARKFPNASASFIKANPGVFNRSPRATPELELDPGDAPHGASPTQKAISPRFLVRVTSYTKQLIDEDNLCEKYHVDLCRYSGIIPEDNPQTAHIETLQIQSETEFTRIEVFTYDTD